MTRIAIGVAALFIAMSAREELVDNCNVERLAEPDASRIILAHGKRICPRP